MQNFNKTKFSILLPKILVVEADPAIGEMLTELFSTAGYDCKVLKNISNIIPIMEKYKPDLVLLEYLLPLVNGGELCTQIKSDQRFKSVPVILYSAYPQILWSVKDYGCDAFMAKPFEIDLLLLQIEKLLARGKEKRRFRLLTDGIQQRFSYFGKFINC